MCGIAGLLAPGSGDADGISDALQKMTRSLRIADQMRRGIGRKVGWRLDIDASQF
jgi:hypothetical protein